MYAPYNFNNQGERRYLVRAIYIDEFATLCLSFRFKIRLYHYLVRLNWPLDRTAVWCHQLTSSLSRWTFPSSGLGCGLPIESTFRIWPWVNMKNFFLLSQLSRLNVSQFYVVVSSPLGLSRNSMLMFTPKTDYSVKRTFRQILQIRLVPIDNGVNIWICPRFLWNS